MSENSTTNKNALVNVELPEFVDKAGENLTTPVTTNIGQTFGDLWFLVFGGISQSAAKRKLKYAVELEAFKSEVESKIDAIPEEKRIEPNMQTVGPALENSKYCVESEEIRTAFANLISRSMNQDYSQYVHPSFADILKQMSPLDAQNLVLFKDKRSYPICDIHYQKDGVSGYTVVFSNLFIANDKQSNFELQAQSISSLIRFGLVEIPAYASLTDKSSYDSFEINPLYNLMKSMIPHQVRKAVLNKKKIDMTPLGEAFIRACL